MGVMFVNIVIISVKVVLKILNLHVTHAILICLDKKMLGVLACMDFMMVVKQNVNVKFIYLKIKKILLKFLMIYIKECLYYCDSCDQ